MSTEAPTSLFPRDGAANGGEFRESPTVRNAALFRRRPHRPNPVVHRTLMEVGPAAAGSEPLQDPDLSGGSRAHPQGRPPSGTAGNKTTPALHSGETQCALTTGNGR